MAGFVVLMHFCRRILFLPRDYSHAEVENVWIVCGRVVLICLGLPRTIITVLNGTVP